MRSSACIPHSRKLGSLLNPNSVSFVGQQTLGTSPHRLFLKKLTYVAFSLEEINNLSKLSHLLIFKHSPRSLLGVRHSFSL